MGGPIHRRGKAALIDEGLQQHRRLTIAPRPVRHHPRGSRASTSEPRLGTWMLGRMRKRLLATIRDRLARRACAHPPIQASRAAHCQAAALKASAPSQPTTGERIR